MTRFSFKKIPQKAIGFVTAGTLFFSNSALQTAASDASNAVLPNEAKDRTWSFSAFGQGVDSKNNGFEGNAADGSVRVYSLNGKGKLVPASTDGLAFYYTAIDPAVTNFTLTATAKVNNWTLSNGQDGFGLMAADRIGTNGTGGVFWNNSYMASVTKVEYEKNGAKISMKLGVGSQEKTGVTLDNLSKLQSNDTATVNSDFHTAMTPLETSCAAHGSGTYNLVGNAKAEVPGTIAEPLTEFTLTIQKNNTGYFLSYTDPSGNISTNKYYDPKALNLLDPDHVYVGFFASRNADVTFTDIRMTTLSPQDDAPAEERPVTRVKLSCNAESSKYANSEQYELVLRSNADGILSVSDQAGTELYAGSITTGKKLTIPVLLNRGENRLLISLTPDNEFRISDHEILNSYDTYTFTHTVNFETWDKDVIYISPSGSPSGTGEREHPADIYTAVSKAAPGQTLLLTEGTYALSKTVTIERGINGTAEDMICLKADPDALTRPVLDFGGKCAGCVFAGNYWHFAGFDVTHSANAQKGIVVAGNYNLLEDIQSYQNGNTGIQISRYKGSDLFEDWPSYNRIVNCTSFLNADSGYEDADGFAAKITTGEGNVFDGCISAYNADDGWDLFAKVESGSIGAVTIKNCVAFKNGYILDASGKEINAGNGNGFKMGGDNLSGHHILINSISFGNKAKGIDSNSCPDIRVQNAISFDNGASNVAFYTGNAANTDFSATGIISFGVSRFQSETLSPKGTQDTSKYLGDTNYYSRGGGIYSNASGTKVQKEWFEDLDMNAFLEGGPARQSDGSYTFGKLSRNADGSINMHGFLSLTLLAPSDAGARLSDDDADMISVLPDPEPEDPDSNVAPSEKTNDKKPGSRLIPVLFITLAIAAAAVGTLFAVRRKKSR